MAYKGELVHTITEKDVGKGGISMSFIDLGNCSCCGASKGKLFPIEFMGVILPQDVGKQIWMADGVPGVENDEQFSARTSAR